MNCARRCLRAGLALRAAFTRIHIQPSDWLAYAAACGLRPAGIRRDQHDDHRPNYQLKEHDAGGALVVWAKARSGRVNKRISMGSVPVML